MVDNDTGLDMFVGGGLPYLVTPVKSSEDWMKYGGKMESRYAALEAETGRVSVNQYLVHDDCVQYVQRLNEKKSFIISKGR